MSKKEVVPRMIWSSQETEDLLEIMQSKFIGKIVMNRHCRKWPIFEEIAQEMERYGHEKNPQQIMFKYKNLCSMYRQVRQNGGVPPKKDKRYEFYDKMHELFSDVNSSISMADDDHDDSTSTAKYDNEGAIVEIETAHEEHEENINLNDNNRKRNYNELPSRKQQILKSEVCEDEDPLRDGEWSGEGEPPRSKRRLNESGNAENVQPYDYLKRFPKHINYVKCVDYLVKGFHRSQEDIQNKFFSQQLKLQQQQQEWEERMLDEEREFFSKILKSTSSRSKNDYEY